MQAQRPLALDDLAKLRYLSDPQIAPDGQQIAFVVETLDLAANTVRSHVWLVDAAGGEPRPLTAGETQDSEPRWSPDGRTLAFVSNRTGARQVWLVRPNRGKPRQLTDHPVGAHGPAWSRDGRRIAFLAQGPDKRGEPVIPDEKDERKRLVRVREHRHKLDGAGFFGAMREHVWLVPSAGGRSVQLTDGPADDTAPAWSPDDARIAYVSDRSADRDRRHGGGAIHVVEVATGEVRRVTPESGRASSPSWSPGGRWLAYVGSDGDDDAGPANARLWIVNLDGKGSRCLTEDLDRSVGQRPGSYLTASPPVWTHEGAVLLYLIGDGPSTHLYRVSELERVPLTAGRLVVHSFSVDRSARRAALLVSDATTPPEICVWDEIALPEVGARPVTSLNGPLLREVALAAPKDLQITRPDGTVVQGWLLRPTTRPDRAAALILNVHGGPHNYFGDAFSFDHQLYAARGYAVLYANPRGSGGYGEAFARAVLEDWGGEDFEDLLAMLDHVIERGDPPIDEKRIGITGSSYGGYLTLRAITQTDRFAVAVGGACISNLVSFFGTSDVGASWGVREFGGTPLERQEWYLDRSPLLRADRVTTPLLLYHGESDLRCPIEQSEQMFTALHHLGKVVEFLRVPTESHGVLNGSPVHRVAVRQAIVEWLGKFL